MKAMLAAAVLLYGAAVRRVRGESIWAPDRVVSVSFMCGMVACVGGGWQFPEPSRFIDEMPQADLKILGRKGGEPIVSHEEGKANLRSMLDMLNAKMEQSK